MRMVEGVSMHKTEGSRKGNVEEQHMRARQAEGLWQLNVDKQRPLRAWRGSHPPQRNVEAAGTMIRDGSQPARKRGGAAYGAGQSVAAAPGRADDGIA
jgi:hypothetical protein